MRILSLCTGYGGLDMGVSAALGGQLIGYSEIKPAAVALLADRHPGIPNYGDLTAATWTGVEADVVTAGWPCQPHSEAGKRLGETDPRAIWPAVAHVIKTVRPALFIGENVARIASNGELRRVIRALAEIGYVGAWRCVTAASVGAPHRRDRCFVVAADPARVRWAEGVPGATGTEGGPDVALGGDEVLRLLPTPEQKLCKSGPDYARAARPLSGGDDLTTAITRLVLFPTPIVSDVNGSAAWGEGGGPGRPLSETVRLLPTPAASVYGRNQGGMARKQGPIRESLHMMARHGQSWGVYAPAVERWEQAYGKTAPSPTQLSTRAPYGPQLAPVFVEWMMGVPEGWVTNGAPGIGLNKHGKWTAPGERNAMLSILGDGVVPQQATAAIASLIPVVATQVEPTGNVLG